jgi:hypothetical protein
MAIYSAYLPPVEDGREPAISFRLVSDAKAPLALIFPPFWLAYHRLWLELLTYAVVALAIALLAVWMPGVPVLYLSAIPGFYLLLEGNELIRRKLERKGWRFAGVSEASTLEDAEIRFITDHAELFEPNRNWITQTSRPDTSPRPIVSKPGGLFPE